MTKTESPRSYKRPESVLVVVHCEQRVLLLKRTDHPDFWQSVTGSLRWDETPLRAARREVAEETGFDTGGGLTAHDHRFRFRIMHQWRSRYAPGVTHNVEHLYSLVLPGCRAPRLRDAEHRAYLWLPREEALERVCSWSNREGIRRVVVQPVVLTGPPG